MPIVVKRALWALGALLLVALLLCALVVALLFSRAGTQWLAGQARTVLGEQAQWDSLEGSLAGDLRLRGVKITQVDLAATIDDVQLQWQPSALLTQTVAVSTLRVCGARIELQSSEDSPSDSTSFDPADIPLPLDVDLDRVELCDIEIVSDGEVLIHLNKAEAQLTVVDRLVEIETLSVAAEEGSLRGVGRVGLTAELPTSLDLDWQWTLPDARRIGGALSLKGNAQALAIEHLGEGAYPHTLHAIVHTPFGNPGWEAELDWPEFAIDATPDAPILGAGQLTTQGNLESYSLAAQGTATLPDQPVITLAVEGQGDSESLAIAALRVTQENYALDITGDVSWSGPVTAALEYRASGENLEQLSEGLPPALVALGQIEAQYEGEQATLSRFELAVEGTPIQLSARGEAQLPAQSEPVFGGRVEWQNLQWPLQGEAEFSSPEGGIDIDGSAEDWRVNLQAATAGSAAPPTTLSMQGRGNAEAFELQNLQAQLLAGDLTFTGLVNWAQGLSWEVEGGGEGFDPSEWLPDMPGQLAFKMSTRGETGADDVLYGELNLNTLEGELMGRPLRLTADAVIEGEALTLQSLTLHNGSNRLSATGKLDGDAVSLDWNLKAPELDAALPGASGTLNASGKITGTTAKPALTLDLKGEQVVYEGQLLAHVAAQGSASLVEGQPLTLALSLGPLSQDGETLMESATVQLGGTTRSHVLDLQVVRTTEQIQGQFTGALDTDTLAWNGGLAQLDLDSEALGAWGLAKSVALSASAESAILEPACFRRRNDTSPTRLCAGANWDATSGSQMDASLEALSLSVLMPELSGVVSGDLQGGLSASGALNATGEFSISPGELRVETAQGEEHLAHEGGELQLKVDGEGLRADLSLRPLQHAIVQAVVELPGMHSVPLPEQQPLSGSLQAAIPDLGGLQAWVPDLEAMRGSFAADLRLAGDLNEPRVLGQLAIVDAAANVPMAGLELREVELRLINESNADQGLLVQGGLRSGPGTLSLDGELAPDGDSLSLQLVGDRVKAYDTPDAEVLVSPDLKLDWAGERVTVRGQVVVPEARITPQLSLAPATAGQEVPEEAAPESDFQRIAPSVDVVLVGAEDRVAQESETSINFELDSQIQLILGDDIGVDALGLKGDIGGEVLFINTPEARELIPNAKGQLAITDGTFRAFGQDLVIDTGQVLFRDVPATEPEVNLRAVRYIDNDPLVSAAGVLVTGPATAPVLEMFSRPQLEPSEVQSYLLTGSSASSGESVLGFGTYLHPKLYVGYGFNLLEETSEFDALYTITPIYGIEASAGEADTGIGVTYTHER